MIGWSSINVTDFEQLSSRVWVKLMYAFWIVLISFAMCTLVLIYSYQFHSFGTLWEQYVGIPIYL